MPKPATKSKRGLDTQPVVDAAAVKVARRQRFNPLRSLEPSTLARALDAFELGELREAALLWDSMRRRDDVLSAVCPKREMGPSRRKMEVLLVENAKGPAADKQKTDLEYFWNNASAVNAFDRNVKGQFSQVVRFIMRAVGDRYSAQHIVWKPSANGITAEFEFIPLYFFENTTGELRYLGPTGVGITGTEIDPDNWLVCGRESGLMEPCSIAYTFKSLSYQDWTAFNEKFGIPYIVGKTNAAKDSAEWDAMVEAVGAFMNDGGAVISTGSEYQILDGSKASNSLPFSGLIERCDRAIASLWLGSDLATMSRGDNSVGASLQGAETIKIEADDCQWVSEQLQRVDKLVLEYLYGEGVEILAQTQIRGPIARDIDKDLKVDQFLIDAGVKLGTQDLAERYERNVAAEGEEAATSSTRKLTEPAVNEKSDEQSIREAIATDLKPVYDALTNVLQAKGDDMLTARLEELETAWPHIIDEVLSGTAAEQAMESILSSAFLEGLDVEQLVADSLIP